MRGRTVIALAGLPTSCTPERLTSRSKHASCTALSISSVVTPGLAICAATSSTSRARRQTLRMPSCSSLFKIARLRGLRNFCPHVSATYPLQLIVSPSNLLAVWNPARRVVWMPYLLRYWSSRTQWIDRFQTTSKLVCRKRVVVAICIRL